jgi:PIN domain nuclease of toxin-antitoxin system
MHLLLDTHAFLWWLAGDKRLSARAKRGISNEDHTVFVSAASVWEIATKHRLGKLPGVEAIVDDLPGVVSAQTFQPLTITLAHAHRAGALKGKHRDPFDRMLVAQALLESLRLVSNEEVFDTFGVERLW